MTDKPQKNWLEWLVFAIGLTLVLGAVGFLVREELTSEPSPARLEITLGKSEARHGHFAVPVTVYNRGNETAAEISIEVLLKTKELGEERAQLHIAYLPRQARREGWVGFTSDPSLAEALTARPLGYERP